MRERNWRNDTRSRSSKNGLARCITEPCGSHGLVGYDLGQSHRFERCQDRYGRFCRVYPDGSLPDYYETCRKVVFAGYFEPVEVREAAKEREGE